MKYIFTADWHLRDDRPRCRPKDENWFELQENSVQFVYDIAKENKADAVCVCGDIFHYPNVSNRIMCMLLGIILGSEIPTYILYGQHDLQNHDVSINSRKKTSYGILYEIALKGKTNIGFLNNIGMACPFGNNAFYGIENGMYFTHQLVMQNKKSFHGSISGISAEKLFDMYPEAEIIVAGDNHHGFIYHGEREGSLYPVIVPGCLNRQKFDLRDYKPKIILWNKDMSVYECFYNEYDMCELIIDNYMEKKNDKDISAFVGSLQNVSVKDLSLSFLDNLSIAINQDSLNDDCISFIKKIIDEVK